MHWAEVRGGIVHLLCWGRRWGEGFVSRILFPHPCVPGLQRRVPGGPRVTHRPPPLFTYSLREAEGGDPRAVKLEAQAPGREREDGAITSKSLFLLIGGRGDPCRLYSSLGSLVTLLGLPSRLHPASTLAPRLTSRHPWALAGEGGARRHICSPQAITVGELTWEYLPQIRGLSPCLTRPFLSLLGHGQGESRWNVLHIAGG